MNKLILIFLVFCCLTLKAQINNYKNDNSFSVWKVLKVNVKEKYVIVRPNKKISNNIVMPLCHSGSLMLFKYKMEGDDDTFYKYNSKTAKLDTIVKFPNGNKKYALKIEVVIDDTTDNSLERNYDNICTANNFNKYVRKGGRKVRRHGVVKYIGVINNAYPF